MTRAELHIRPAEPTFDEDQLAGVVSFDRVADELQQIADHERDQRPRRRVLLVPNEKMDRQHERDRQADQMKRHVAGMQMAFAIILEEAAHGFVAVQNSGVIADES